MKKYLAIAFLITVTSVIFTPNAVHAMGIDLKKLKPLDAIELIPKEEFEKQTTIIEAVPYEDDFLAFQVRLPKGWEQSQSNKSLNEFETKDALSRRVLGVVTRYVSPAKNLKRNSFSVEALKLSYEVSARNWFIDYIVKKGLSLEQVGEGTDDEVNALYVEVNGDQTNVVRVRAIKNGPRIIVARYYVPLSDYKEESVMQATVLDSFELINRENNAIERFKTHAFLDQSYFDYPTSWRLNAPYIRSINRMRAGLYHSSNGGKDSGQIKIFLTSKDVETTRSKELAEYRKQVTLDGYQLGRKIEQFNLPMHEDISYSLTNVYQYNPLSTRLLDHEMWFTFLEGADYYYYVFMLTPSRQANFSSWSRNTEAHKRVLKSLRRDSDVDQFGM